MHWLFHGRIEGINMAAPLRDRSLQSTGRPADGRPTVDRFAATAFADESTRRLNRLWEHFPNGLAPYSRAIFLTFAVIGGIVVNQHLLRGVYGFLQGLFPGGIIAAGIIGAVNLRRADRARPAALLLVTSLLLALIAASMGHLVVASVESQVSQSSDSPMFRMEVTAVLIALDVVYALIVDRSQRHIRRHWNMLSEKDRPSIADQGGFQGMIGWLLVVLIVNVVLSNVFYGVLAPQLTAVAFIGPP
ncbi:MAG: hypothetical protein IPK19_01340 [Chloroflexi bacterium]|nr:hypothetical protein [Chloroflexota bacterium]